MSHLTRREVLSLGVAGLLAPVVAVGLRAQGLGAFTTSAGTPSCSNSRQPTPATQMGHYRASAPVRTSLRTGSDVSGTPLHLTGSVIGLKCGAIKDARVESWQADEQGRFDPTGFRLRGQQQTNAHGGYLIDTIIPGGVAGSALEARRLYLRVTPPNHAALATIVFFPDDPARTKDPEFRASLVMTYAALTTPGRTATFDVVFDL